MKNNNRGYSRASNPSPNPPMHISTWSSILPPQGFLLATAIRLLGLTLAQSQSAFDFLRSTILQLVGVACNTGGW